MNNAINEKMSFGAIRVGREQKQNLAMSFGFLCYP